MKKILAFTAGFLLLLSSSLKADEGMWLLPLLEQLNMQKMTSMGLQLTADDIYSINHASLKDAVVMFDGGCTGEIVSDQGLILTNHHCGYEYIQQHSSVAHDYLENGFWAMSRDQELVTPGLTVTFLVRIEDVTTRINSALSVDMTESQRQTKIMELSAEIEQEATQGTQYIAEVDPFFGGNNFYLLVYERYEDVRFVGAPPSSIGKFGDETDNWMWPRHTGDFSVFRVYTSPDGKPAPYSPSNIPMKPKHFFPINIHGLQKGDFTMVIGYPGGTDRYMTSFGVMETRDVDNTVRINVRTVRQKLLMEDMSASDSIRIMYASKYARSSNYWKFSIGQNKGIANNRIIERKQELETEFSSWVKADALRTAKYGECLDLLQNGYQQRKPYYLALQYTYESLIRGIEVLTYSRSSLRGLNKALTETPDSTKLIESLAAEARTNAVDFYKDFNPATDCKVAKAMLKLYVESVPIEFQADLIKDLNVKAKGNFDKYVDGLYKKSFLASKSKLLSFLAKPNKKVLENDPFFKLYTSVSAKFNELRNQYFSYADKVDKGQRLFISGLMEMQSNRVFYPDANFTMRLTYGTIGDYSPRDAVQYDWYTTLKGVMEKEDSTNYEFIVPAKLKQLFKDKDYGRYGSNGELITCFTSNNDITGGNSGSPVINGKGELIGIAFDGNWEALTGDIEFEPKLQKCINVDIRYVLFVIDKFAGATHLVNEMKIIE